MKNDPQNKGLIVEIRFVGNGDGSFRGDNFNVYIPAQHQHGVTASKTYWCKSLMDVPTRLKQALGDKHIRFEPHVLWYGTEAPSE
jgi:hypothetical protein